MNVWRELRSGALDGADGVMSGEGPWGRVLEVGLEEKREETISWGKLERGIAVSVTFCLLESLVVVGSSGDGPWVALAGRVGLISPVIWSFLRRYSALFLADNLSFQRPPRKTGVDRMKPSSIEKFINRPSSAITELRGFCNKFSMMRIVHPVC